MGAMECGGRDIWLASSNAWGKKSSKQLSITGSSNSHGSEYSRALSKYIRDDKEVEDSSSSTSGNKWWCKFGHSRRGLEHVVSSREGKARQQAVLLAVSKVMEEQQRQRKARTKDPNKLRNISLQYTSWARDLALAAGAADAEAVSSNFDQAAKTRAHYYAKKMTGSIDSFNHDAVGDGVVKAVTSQILDEFTHGKPKLENAII